MGEVTLEWHWSDKRGGQDQRPISTNLWEEEELSQLSLGRVGTPSLGRT